jgi:hypothetical protein
MLSKEERDNGNAPRSRCLEDAEMNTQTAAEVGTCQVCGRTIGAKTGMIAHHGYQRPYEGWQTASCEGARYLPYEISCDRLREVIETVQTFIASQEEALADFLATPPATLIENIRRSSWDKIGTDYTYTRPDAFDHTSLAFRFSSDRPRTYECAYRNRKSAYERTIRLARADVVTMQRRLNEWKPVQ